MLARLRTTQHCGLTPRHLGQRNRPGGTPRPPRKGAGALAEPVCVRGHLAARLCPCHHRRHIDRGRDSAGRAVLQRATGRKGGQARHGGSVVVLFQAILCPRIACSPAKTAAAAAASAADATERAEQSTQAARRHCEWAERAIRRRQCEPEEEPSKEAVAREGRISGSIGQRKAECAIGSSCGVTLVCGSSFICTISVQAPVISVAAFRVHRRVFPAWPPSRLACLCTEQQHPTMATLTQPTQRRGKSVHSVNVNYDAVPVPQRSPSPTSSKRPASGGGGGGDLSLKGISEDGRRSPIPGDVYGYPSSKVGVICAPSTWS